MSILQVSLKSYKAKRDFRRTNEPEGGAVKRGSLRRVSKPKQLRFVVQKHDATRLHYDFRLEMEGVLKSWAVPKGFPTQKGERRLAVQVEDHPIEYGGFEGTIPEGNYGAGTVMLWDRGTYSTDKPQPLKALKDGKLHLTLNGKKLIGDWTLVRMRQRNPDEKPQWLLLKSGENIQPFSARAEAESVLTHRTMDEIAGAKRRKEWKSNRSRGAASAESNNGVSVAPRSQRLTKRTGVAAVEPKRANRVAIANIEAERLPKAGLAFVAPMKALLVDKLPTGRQWVYEVKFDGVRAIGIKRGSAVELISRSGKSLTGKYPEIAQAIGQLPLGDATLDGEVVATDEQGRCSFQLLQSADSAGSNRPPIFYYVFDLLNLEGNDLENLSLEDRKSAAEALFKHAPPRLRFSPSLKAQPGKLLTEMQQRGFEGIIAKRKDSRYEAGQRSGAWLKYKWTQEQEFVIGGFTQPKGSRSHFGAIMVGYYEQEKLLFAGKVGTGFQEKILRSLYQQFKKLMQPECPFTNLPEPGQGMTAGQMKTCTWLKPELVCQVRFAEWTRDGHLRQPAFQGLREDKKSDEVVRERAV